MYLLIVYVDGLSQNVSTPLISGTRVELVEGEGFEHAGRIGALNPWKFARRPASTRATGRWPVRPRRLRRGHRLPSTDAPSRSVFGTLPGLHGAP